MEKSSTLPAPVTASELDELRTLIEERSAILFDASRERFFAPRVTEYLRESGEPNLAALLRRIRGSNVEYDLFLNKLLTQETSFFRYPDIFQALEKVVLPEAQARNMWRNPRVLRIWSAGCSTGEEAYSIAITVADTLPFADAWQIEILATDISREALQQAERGVYSGRSLANLTPPQLETHFKKKGNAWEVKPRIRKMISFAPMNLARSVYVGRMDCIFCMNVLMYFSEQRRNELIQRFHDTLEPGGLFFLGHSESLKSAPVKFETAVHGHCQYYVKPAAKVEPKLVAPGSGS
ncbi:MAG TPA: protein-glutamate O-methyltransferase CheR [Verrucomicrobiae bacterium]|jgi:chemotaxis protein methyltransferase CheR|nr:protein-glutamate O-methyltransferase CheR [Verrucomicrobiae bacterium]